jgi:GrpB-like predicted nucleotidyltransferase (UPF0157 family)
MILAPHNPAWAAEFALLREIYLGALGPLILRVEHVGSTAVPCLSAKPILDIDIVMPGYEMFPGIESGLRGLGYRHNGDQGIEGREAFKAQDREAPYTWPKRTWMAHHLYVCCADGAELRRHLLFRDALRARADFRHEYERVKVAIAARSGGDRKAYARIKEIECRDFVERVLREYVAP